MLPHDDTEQPMTKSSSPNQGPLKTQTRLQTRETRQTLNIPKTLQTLNPKPQKLTKAQGETQDSIKRGVSQAALERRLYHRAMGYYFEDQGIHDSGQQSHPAARPRLLVTRVLALNSTALQKLTGTSALRREGSPDTFEKRLPPTARVSEVSRLAQRV